jgi:hypothetical protein
LEWCGDVSARRDQPSRQAIHATNHRSKPIPDHRPGVLERLHRGEASRRPKKVADFLHTRFRPEARKVLDAWLQTDPFSNPDAPLRPFDMAEYAQPEREAAWSDMSGSKNLSLRE